MSQNQDLQSQYDSLNKEILECRITGINCPDMLDKIVRRGEILDQIEGIPFKIDHKALQLNVLFVAESFMKLGELEEA
jgi:hypothetical protein